jgi:hypothetical protein
VAGAQGGWQPWMYVCLLFLPSSRLFIPSSLLLMLTCWLARRPLELPLARAGARGTCEVARALVNEFDVR